ncbi:hypothetical protein [Teichococcus aestuarii]|uniref:hypothetical protein n=1 Tax=Teichococcus aestuarii TaxID=568898 RepID=UPI003608E4CB
MTTPYACICPAKRDQPHRICGVNHPQCAALRVTSMWPLADDEALPPPAQPPHEMGAAVPTVATSVSP